MCEFVVPDSCGANHQLRDMGVLEVVQVALSNQLPMMDDVLATLCIVNLVGHVENHPCA